MTTPFRITDVSSPGTWFVTCVLIGSPKQSRAGGSSASASSGQGGWQVVDRTRQKAATEWLDYYPMVLTCTCLLTGAIARSSGATQTVEGWITTLESFEKPVPGSAPPLPPILTISGPVQHTEMFWVCSRLELAGGEEGAIRNTAGQRTQQAFTIELTEYSPSYALTSPGLSPAQQALAPSSTAGLSVVSTATMTSYTVATGDTLQSIAAVQMGSVSYWPLIAAANNLTASAILTAGRVLYLPAAT